MLKTLTAGLCAGVLVAAASAYAGEEPDAEPPDPRIGEEVNSICFARTINGWKGLKGVDDVVLLEKGVNDWYYVELQGYCPSRIFRSAERIGIESKPAGGCVTRGDVIIVRDFGGFTNRCFITRIYKWDDKAQPAENGEESPPEEESEAK